MQYFVLSPNFGKLMQLLGPHDAAFPIPSAPQDGVLMDPRDSLTPTAFPDLASAQAAIARTNRWAEAEGFHTHAYQIVSDLDLNAAAEAKSAKRKRRKAK